jgi:hypothetical protein
MKDKVSFLQSARFVKVVFQFIGGFNIGFSIGLIVESCCADNPLQIAHTSDHTAGEPSTTYLG